MYRVDGFDFESEEMAEIARKEKNGIKYIKEKTKMDDPFEVAKLYTQLSRPGMFKTAVGFAFLIELQEYLYANPYIENTDIRCIRIPDEEKLRQRHEMKYKKKFHIALFFAIIFAGVIVALFTITYVSGHSPYITDYEDEIVNKYEAWEKQLDEREQALDQKEADTQWKE